ncbi:hypothetical protein I0C86_28360 [Plantactinospora sp. S1510]|uniref:Lipoprotein n=1 Tax=Plantactinospora alkalitolerans TaxID=2789879 RepID=A0ABS0H3G9_9ACTN|nr:hypothetical protein [Plantactinospora alkalitolerans]MBF9132841.1 hypothetical protein [Plantactinospora alkalitolerans]
MIKRLLVVCGAALTLVTLVGCADAYEDFEPEWTPTGARPMASFDAKVARRAEDLDIRYTFRNQGTESIVAYVGVEGGAASHAWDVYVSARKDDTVEVAKRTFVIPPGVDADAIGTIEGMVIPPGEEVTEKFSIDLPLEGNRPYVGRVKLPEPVREVVFCLGAVRQREAATPKRAENGRGKYPLNGPQHLFCSPPTKL